jgi:hypothetical protein
MRELVITGVREIGDVRCELEFDGFIPLQIRTYQEPIGAGFLRLGNYSTTLLELAIEPHSQTVRGAVITSMSELAAWPALSIVSQMDGLPVLATDFQEWRVIDLDLGFEVATRASEFVAFWGPLDGCTAYACGRFRFLAHEGRLVGILCVELTSEEQSSIRSLVAHQEAMS